MSKKQLTEKWSDKHYDHQNSWRRLVGMNWQPMGQEQPV